MTSSSSSHHHDGSSANSTPRAGASSGSSYGNGNGNGQGQGNGGHGNGNGNGNGGHGNGNGGHGNGNGNGGHGNGNGGNYHHHPPPHASSSQALALALGGPCVRLTCSFGGRILPRPGDHRLRYVGGETRIVSIPRTNSHAVLTAALARLAPALFAPGAPRPALRYHLPQDDLDSLISVSSDDDVDNLMDEIDRVNSLAVNDIKPPRLRLFIFAASPDHAFGSMLSGTGGDASMDKWFVDQLNAPPPSSHERSRSEASSIVSENMDPEATPDDPSADTPSEAAAADPKAESDKEMAHGDDDDKPAPALRDRPVATTYVAEAAPWPAAPPQYMQHPLYLYPPRPLHYVDAAGRQCTYVPGPGYHIIAGEGDPVQGDVYGSGSVYGGLMQLPYRHHMVYTPPIVATEQHPKEGKPKEAGGSPSHSS